MAEEDLLQRIVDLINRIEESVTALGRLQLNASQCRYVSERLSDTRQFLQTEALQKSQEQIPKPLKELHRIVAEADANVRDCCESAWIPTAIRQAKNEEAFFEVLKDLHWCTGVVITAVRKYDRNAADSGTIISDSESALFFEHTPSADEAEEKVIRSQVDKAAEVDLRALESKLGEVLQGLPDQAGLSEDDLAIARHLASWLSKDDSISYRLEIQQGPFIDRGGYSPVFKSTWLSQTVAEKSYLVGAAAAQELFKEEATVMRDMRHPNVVRLVAKDDVKCKLVMELMDGNLTSLIKKAPSLVGSPGESSSRIKGPFPLPETLDKLLQIATGMLYLHVKRVAHRDIKSGNILYLRDPRGYDRLKVADFGLAKVKEKSRIDMTADQGTLHITAPELFRKRKGENVEHGSKSYVHVNHALRADVYSFGITCFEVLTGETNPYGAVPQLAKKVVEGLRPQLPEYLPPALADLVRVCWAPDPEDRPTFDYIYKFLRDFKASLLTDSPFSYEPWNSKMDPSLNAPEKEPEAQVVVDPKFSVMAWAIGAVSWLLNTRIKTLEEITSQDVSSLQLSYEDLLKATSMDRGESNNMRPVRLSKGVEAMMAKTIAQSRGVFLKRAFFLTQLQEHPHIPKIIGYAVDNDDFYLVHKADSVNVVGSLHEVMGLSDGDFRVRHFLTWAQRYNIALGVGKALAHLHQLSTPIIHGNLSSRNIMLEEDTYNPRLFNFYRSFMVPDPEVHSKNFPTNDTQFRRNDLFFDTELTLHWAGGCLHVETSGWNAPEKDSVHGAFEQDVFSFGVLLLVLVTGKNAFTASNMTKHVHIVDEAWKCFNEGRLMELEGPGVNGKSDVVFRVLKVALYCVHKEADKRPKIAEAVDMLLGKTQVKVHALRMSSLTLAQSKVQQEPSSSSAITYDRKFASDVSEKVGR